MPIKSYSGKPGNGKTALMMERLLAESKKTGKDARPLFQSGIDGIVPGIATEIEDPRRWNDVDPDGPPECTCEGPLAAEASRHKSFTGEPMSVAEFSERFPDRAEQLRAPHCHVLRNGALWFVDEAWKWFGHLHDATRQATPKHVLALAEHRHRGIDMVWTFQGPNQIYPFARPLMDEHHHTVRRFGSPVIDVYKWEELQEDVKSQAKRDQALRETRALPSAVFGMYKSADAHTIKTKIPKRVLMLPVLAIGAGLAIWFAYSTLKPSAFAADLTGKEPGAAQAAPALTGSRVESDEEKPPISAGEYAKKHLPRFATMPWTAPIFDERSVTADPMLVCMSSDAGEDSEGNWREAGCSCLTEQGTRYDIAQGECLRLARHGPVYNPYRERRPDQVAQAKADHREEGPATIALDAPQISNYGDIEAGQP